MAEKHVYATIDEYIEDQPAVTRAALASMKEWILEAAPGAEELFNYDIPAFALIKGGKREEQIMMAGYAKHIGFYPHPTTMEQFEDELADYRHAKGSVQFPLNKPLPKDLIVRMVLWRKGRLEKNGLASR